MTEAPFEQGILSDDGSHAAGSAELRGRDGKVKQGEQELLHAQDSVGQNSGVTQYCPSRIGLRLRLAREFRIRDPQGNIVVVHINTNAVHTFSSSGDPVNTEHAIDPGNDGLVILDDGTKYVCSVRRGTVSRSRPGQAAEIIASGIPSAASMAYDSKRHRLIIPMNNWNAVTFVDLD